MRAGFVSAVFAAVMVWSAANAATVEEFKAEDWEGLAFTSDETGQFTHCSVYASYRNGSTLYISYEAGDSWFFSVANDSWKLTEGGSFAIKFKVDRRGQVEGTGTALGPTQIGLPVEVGHPFLNQLRRGRELVISFQDKDYVFELSNSNRAMNAARDCVRRHVALGTHTPIIASGTSDEPAVQESKQESQPEEQQPEQQAATEQPAEPAEPESTSDSEASPADSAKPAQASGEQQKFGPWVVTEADDDAGKFVNCTAYDVQGDDQLILSYFADKSWTFGLYRSAWNLDTNQTYYLWYNVDGPADAQDVVKRPVEVPEATRIYFDVSGVEDIIDRMENGTTLNLELRGVTGPAESYSYSLDQAPAAFEATRKCVEDHSGGETQAQADDQASADRVDAGRGREGQAESTGSEETSSDSEAPAGEDEPSSESTTEPSPTEADSTTAPTEGGNAPQAPLPTLGETKLEDIQVLGWRAGAYALADGTFTHCSINAEYQNGGTLDVAITAEGDVLLAVQHKDWTLKPDTSVPMSFTLKAGTSYSNSVEAQAIDQNVIMADIGRTDDLAATVGGASEIDISAEGKDLSFDTSDIGPAIDAIEKCVAQHASDAAPAAAPAAEKGVAPSSEANPDVASATPSEEQASPPPASETPAENQVASTGNQATDDAAYHTEAAGYTTALLIRSGYANHIILNGDDVPEAFRSHRAAWKLADLVGVTDMVAGTVDEIKDQVFSSDTKDCDGEITTTVDGVSGSYEHLHTVCKKEDSTITVHYLVIPRDAGGSYMLSIIDTGDGTKAEEVAGKVYSIAVPM